MENKQYLTVSALVKYIKYKLENDDHLKQIYLRGEISNFVKHSRGHLYFSIKDEESQIRAIMFSNAASKLPFTPKDGDKVLVFGAIDLYVQSGQYSIQVWQMEPDGIGNLYLQYEKLKNDLEAKGYFDVLHKKPIPQFPTSIGIITSPTGAAIKDMLQTIERRYPLAKVILYPALVQGDGAKISVSNQIKKANMDGLVDVLLVGRGGGSIEDLWAFNEIEVIEAIYNSNIPIISAIGHETDFTISDFVSDLRAPTPTGAAELATPDKNVLVSTVLKHQNDLSSKIMMQYNNAVTKLVYLEKRLMNQNPLVKIKETFNKYKKINYDLNRNFSLLIENKQQIREQLDNRLKRIDYKQIIYYKEKDLLNSIKNLNNNFENNIVNKTQQLKIITTTLENQNPLKLMNQGYTFTLKEGKKVTSIEEVNIKETIETVLKDGKIYSEVMKKEKSK